MRNALFQTILLLTLLWSCFDDPSGTKNRSRVADTATPDTTVETQICTEAQLVNNEGNKCFQGVCPSNYHLVTSKTELDNILQTYNEELAPNLSAEEDVKRRQNFFRARGLCQLGATPSRPTNEINIVEDICVCKNRLAINLNSCGTVCANRSADVNATLVINTSPSSAILNDPRFIAGNELTVGTLNSWCNTPIDDGKTGPNCSVQVYNGTNTFELKENLKFEQQNTISVTVGESLADNTTYLGRIVENTSNAKSVPFQFRLKRDLAEIKLIDTPLKIEPMYMYTCFYRKFTQASENVSSESYIFSFRLSMFDKLENAFEPQPVANTSQLQLFCHDFQRNGKNDSSSYPRLESFSHIFSLWDKDDNRFTNQGAGLEINNIIHKRLLTEYGRVDTDDYFFPFYGGSNGARYHPLISRSLIQGFILTAFEDENNGTSYCPNSAHYNSTEPKFKVLKEIIGVETEGLFMGVMTPVVYTSPASTVEPITNVDVIFIRESLVNQLWFYTERNSSGVNINIVPTAETAHTKNLKFYWPPNFDDPIGVNNNFRKKLWQEEYQILSSEDAKILIDSATGNEDDGTAAEIPTSIRPSDKRFGCVPKE